MLLPCFSMVPQHQEKSIIPNVDNDGQSQISQLQLGEEASADGSSSHPPSTSGSSNEAEAARSSDTSSRGGLSSANSTGNSSLELFGFTRFYLGAISTARWVFLGGLLVAALGLATSVFLVLEKEENDAFEAKVSTSRTKVRHARCCVLTPSILLLV